MLCRSFLVALFLAAALVQSAPINGDQLLDNIEMAASVEADKANDAADQDNKNADQMEAQLKSNQQFAKKMTGKVMKDAKMLNDMKEMEQQTIDDARQIKGDAENINPDNVADDDQEIEQIDADAEKMSNKIQSTAEKLDNKLKGIENQMADAGVTEEQLGESRDPDMQDPELDAQGGADTTTHSTSAEEDNHGDKFNAQLQAAEDQANSEVQDAKDNKNLAADRLASLNEKMEALKSEASDGMSRLKKAETRLSTDLNGHTDQQLESDIEEKAEDMETALSSRRETTLGESPLEAAEREAEEASSDDTEAIDTMDDTQDASDDTAFNAPQQQDQQAVDQGEVSADLSAIESDAQQLVAYQKQSIQEIKKIQAPLQ